MSGDLRNLTHLVSLLPSSGLPSEEIHWGVAGIGRFQLPMAVHATVMGGHVRVGFEDNIWFNKGELAKSNAQLVERVAKISRDIGREVATPTQARQMLGLS
jgi:3-keto-5-aminohexanoate cleavage enzyme